MFTSKAAEERYYILTLRSPILDRGLKVSITTDIGGRIHNNIEGYSWRKFCASPEYKANFNFVYEFYINLLDNEGDIMTVGVEMSTSAPETSMTCLRPQTWITIRGLSKVVKKFQPRGDGESVDDSRRDLGH